MSEVLVLLGRGALALALLALALWWAFSYGMATFTPIPFWMGVLSVAALVASWKIWPRIP